MFGFSNEIESLNNQSLFRSLSQEKIVTYRNQSVDCNYTPDKSRKINYNKQI